MIIAIYRRRHQSGVGSTGDGLGSDIHIAVIEWEGKYSGRGFAADCSLFGLREMKMYTDTVATEVAIVCGINNLGKRR